MDQDLKADDWAPPFLFEEAALALLDLHENPPAALDDLDELEWPDAPPPMPALVDVPPPPRLQPLPYPLGHPRVRRSDDLGLTYVYKSFAKDITLYDGSGRMFDIPREDGTVPPEYIDKMLKAETELRRYIVEGRTKWKYIVSQQVFRTQV